MLTVATIMSQGHQILSQTNLFVYIYLNNTLWASSPLSLPQTIYSLWSSYNHKNWLSVNRRNFIISLLLQKQIFVDEFEPLSSISL